MNFKILPTQIILGFYPEALRVTLNSGVCPPDGELSMECILVGDIPTGLCPGGIHLICVIYPVLMEGCSMGITQMDLNPNGIHPDVCILLRLILLWGCPKGFIPYPDGFFPVELILWDTSRGVASCRAPSRSIQPGFFPLYVLLWQTDGDVVLQDFSFPSQNSGCCPKPAGSLPCSTFVSGILWEPRRAVPR